MAEGNSLINLGDLSKPATVLIEKISDAIGCIFKPSQIMRVAKAEAEAEKIKTLAAIEITEIQNRALQRLVHEEGKKQENIENITAEAINQLNSESNPEQIEEDWLSHFFEKAKLVSNTEMQSLWSRLLAGEANSPGAYSKRTIELIATLDRVDAELFSNLCVFAISSGDIFPIIFDPTAGVYQKRQINFAKLCHLEDLGLIKFENVAGYVLRNQQKIITLAYYGIPISITFAGDNGTNSFEIGKVMLTKAGKELAPICGSTADLEFAKYLVGQWRSKGYEVATSIA